MTDLCYQAWHNFAFFEYRQSVHIRLEPDIQNWVCKGSGALTAQLRVPVLPSARREAAGGAGSGGGPGPADPHSGQRGAQGV